MDAAMEPHTEGPANEETLASARRWATFALVSGGLSGLLVPVLGCLLLITMGVGMFLFPVLIPGFLVGFICAVRARRIEDGVNARTSRTNAAYAMNGMGLAVSLALSLIAGGVALIAYLGR